MFICSVNVPHMPDPDYSIKRKYFTLIQLSDLCCCVSIWISHLKEKRQKNLSRIWNLQNLNWFSVASVSLELTPSKRCQEYSSNSAQSWVVVCQEVVRLLSDWLLISGTALSSLQPTHTGTPGIILTLTNNAFRRQSVSPPVCAAVKVTHFLTLHSKPMNPKSKVYIHKFIWKNSRVCSDTNS